MDRKAVAKELRQRLFDFIEAERREALQDAAIDDLFEKVLAPWSKPSAAEVDLISPEELCRTWTASSPEISPPRCNCKPDTTICGRCWPVTMPATGQD